MADTPRSAQLRTQTIFSSLIMPLYGFFNSEAGAAVCGRGEGAGTTRLGATHDDRSNPSLEDILADVDSSAEVIQPCGAVR